MTIFETRKRSGLDTSTQPKTQQHSNTGRTAARLVLLCLVTSFFAAAADDLTPTIVYHPGDTIHLFASFREGGVAFDSGFARFSLQGQPRDGQKSFTGTIDTGPLTKVSDHEYELSKTVTDAVASGDYLLEFIIGSSSGLSRKYNFQTDFQSKILVHIENPKRVDFPDIKSVTLKQ